MKYWAFISYSHRDAAWGTWLHRSLEAFRVPTSLVGRPGREGEPVPPRIVPVFRDREELPTTADLGGSIEEALTASRVLVVICSPRSATSRWVDQEILQFKRLGREDRVLALVVDGVPNASEKPGEPPNAECFPPSLRYALDATGDLDPSRRREPIAADARPEGDGRAVALLKVVAGVLGVGYDELAQRHERARRRRLRVALFVVSALLLVFAGLGAAALWQRDLAVERGREADLQRGRAEAGLVETRRALAESLLTLARQRVESGARAEAAVLFAQANVLHPGPYARTNAQALLAVLPRLAERWPFAKPTALPTFGPVAWPDSRTLHAVVRLAAVVVAWWAFDDPRPERTLDAGSVLRGFARSPDGSLLLTGGQAGFARLWDARTLEPVGQPMDARSEDDAAVNVVRFSPDGRLALTTDSGGSLRLWRVPSGALAWGVGYAGCKDVRFTPDSSTLVACSAESQDVRFWEAATGAPKRAPVPLPAPAAALALTPAADHLLVVCSEGEGCVAYLWDLRATDVAPRKIVLPAEVFAAALAPEAAYAAFLAADRLLLLALGEEAAEIRSLRLPALASAIGFDERGTMCFAAGPGDRVGWWTLADRLKAAEYGGSTGETFAVAEHAAGALLGDPETHVASDARMPRPPAVVLLGTAEGNPHVAFSPDGAWLAWSAGQRVWIHDARTGISAAEVLLEDGPTAALDFEGPSLRIFHGIAGGFETLAIEPATGRDLARSRVSGPFVRAVRIHPGLRAALVEEREAPANVVLLVRLGDPTGASDGGQITRLEFPGRPSSGFLASGITVRHTGQPLAHAFSGDGSRLAVATVDRIVRLYDVATGRLLRELPPAASHVERLALSHGGDRVAVATADLAVRVVDLASGASVGRPPGGFYEPPDLEFTRDDRHLLAHVGWGAKIADLFEGARAPRTVSGTLCADGPWGLALWEELAAVDLATGLPIGAPIRVSSGNDGLALLGWSARAGRALLQLQGRLYLWPAPAHEEAEVAPEDLLRRASRQTGLEVVELNRVRPLSPARWRALPER